MATGSACVKLPRDRGASRVQRTAAVERRLDRQVFKNALACWASGVTVVAARLDGAVYGITASSFSSVSLDPPLVSVCIHHDSPVLTMVAQAGRFTVSILGHDQAEASNQFASSGRTPAPDLAPTPTEWLDGEPTVAGATARIVCALHEAIPMGDHTVLFGRVEHAAVAERDPLVYYRRAYRTVTG